MPPAGSRMWTAARTAPLKVGHGQTREDHEPCDGVDERAVRYLGEGGNDTEDDKRQEGEESKTPGT